LETVALNNCVASHAGMGKSNEWLLVWHSQVTMYQNGAAGETMIEQLMRESHLILIEGDLCKLRVTLDALKTEASSEEINTGALCRKHEDLMSLINEINILTQYRKELAEGISRPYV
jgi:hypothetical protein